MADRLLYGLTGVALIVIAGYSVRAGAILLGALFVGAALARKTGLIGEFFTSRRQRTDIAVLLTFALALIVLAAVLPRR